MMVRLAQKIWYEDGSTRVDYFEADSAEEAQRLAYAALDVEIASQWARGHVSVVKALCADTDVVDVSA